MICLKCTFAEEAIVLYNDAMPETIAVDSEEIEKLKTDHKCVQDLDSK